MLTVTVQRSLINISKKAATGWELTQTKKQQTLYFDCAKHINYKKIYIYMYIQQTILCKHGKYVSFSENMVSSHKYRQHWHPQRSQKGNILGLWTQPIAIETKEDEGLKTAPVAHYCLSVYHGVFGNLYRYMV